MSYYSLPSVKCSERKNILNDLYTTDTQKCLNINPDEIYDNLFPGFNNPMSKFNTIKGTGFNNVNSFNDITQDECSSNCLLNENCKYFDYKNATNTCTLLNTNDPETTSNTNSGLTSNIYKKKTNTCNTNDPDCIDCQDFCPTTNDDSYELTGSGLTVNDINQQISSSAVSSLDKCMDNCNDDTKCKAILYSSSSSSCPYH